MRERERGAQIETDRQTDRQTNRQAGTFPIMLTRGSKDQTARDRAWLLPLPLVFDLL